jgi:hypothetical protein
VPASLGNRQLRVGGVLQSFDVVAATAGLLMLVRDGGVDSVPERL